VPLEVAEIEVAAPSTSKGVVVRRGDLKMIHPIFNYSIDKSAPANIKIR
jgi:hypothetical protein